MASTAHFSEEEMAELREAFSKVGECSQQQRHCWGVNLRQALVSCSDWPAARKWRLLQHWSVVSQPPQKALFLPLQASQVKPHQLTAEHQPLTEGRCWGFSRVYKKSSKDVQQTMLEILSSVFPRILFSHDKLSGRQKMFYFNLNWVFRRGRKSVERKNMQMD